VNTVRWLLNNIPEWIVRKLAESMAHRA